MNRNALLQYILNRLSEASTWAGIVGIITAAGVYLSPDQIHNIIAAGLAVVGLLHSLLPDSMKAEPPKAAPPARQRHAARGRSGQGADAAGGCGSAGSDCGAFTDEGRAVNDREGKIWSAIRRRLPDVLDRLLLAIKSEKYEESSIYLDGVARTLAEAVEAELKDQS